MEVAEVQCRRRGSSDVYDTDTTLGFPKQTIVDGRSMSASQSDPDNCMTLPEMTTNNMSCNDSGIVLDDAHNETSILSFFEDSSQPVYSETDEKSIVVNGVTHGNGVTGDDSAEVDEALVNGEEEEWRDVEKVAAETVAVATEEASPVPNLVEVQIVEESDESPEERERKEEEEQVGETEETRVEEEEEEEEEAVQFIRGMTCTDITTALLILKTKYKLTDIVTKKAILSWSCWNLTDMIHTPDETFWWWSSTKVPGLGNTHSLQLAEPDLNNLSEAMVQQIIERAKEIEDLLAEVLEKERLKKEEEEEEKRRQEQEQLALEEPVVVSPPATETMSSPCVASPDDHDTIDQQVEDEVDRHFGPRDIPSKKKRRNVFARMIHAVRKRFAHRQRS
ncbi:hypothetical protein NP493_544g01004 [Ridgeia piscesae]|uniref:Uncharacterized protein n=1 Tax=Ridgeia piscesae TaxID=27915 RepID=A0AAD9NPY1_RIDPI|nr:hypothetical protein NP493_544g01004 [Ridgeia piscesae]